MRWFRQSTQHIVRACYNDGGEDDDNDNDDDGDDF